MEKNKFKNIIGLVLIVSHFLVIVLTIIYFFLGGFKFSELTTTISLIIPIYATYTSYIIKDIVKHSGESKHKKKTYNYNKVYIFITLFVISLFNLFLISIISLKAFNIGFQDYDQFKILLALTETIFGVYVGQLIAKLFNIPQNIQMDNASGDIAVKP